MEKQPLQLEPGEFRVLFSLFGPSLGLWRAAEIAVLRQQVYQAPVLDLGCGDGLVTSFVLKNVDYGLDPDADALQNAARLNIYSNVIARDMQSAQLPDASISTILSNSVLEHIPQIDQVLSTAARILMPGGQFIFTVPSEGFTSNLLFPWKGYAARRNRHFQHLNI